MSDTEWRLRGDYFETCNCDYLCLCQEIKQDDWEGKPI